MGVYSDVMEQFLNMSEVIKAYRFLRVEDNPSSRLPHADQTQILTTRPQVTLARRSTVERDL